MALNGLKKHGRIRNKLYITKRYINSAGSLTDSQFKFTIKENLCKTYSATMYSSFAENIKFAFLCVSVKIKQSDMFVECLIMSS